MIQNQTQGESIRKEFFKIFSLSKTNRQIAEIWLDMDQPEEESVLDGIERQDLSKIAHYLGEQADYPGWLRKKKRTEELKRYIRLIVEVGGSTACELLVQFKISVEMPRLMCMLDYLTGARAEEQKLAVQAGFCTLALLRMRSADVKALCQSGAGDPEVFLRAAEYCYDTEGEPGAVKWSRSRLLLWAMYLHHKEAGTAPEIAEALAQSLTAAIAGLMAFEKPELRYIQNFARTAGQDTPFPQRILSIYQERKSGINPSLLAGCACLALDHSVRFEILLRLMVAVDCRVQGRNLALETCMGITEADWFDTRMEQIEEMLPILDEDYVLWCLYAGYTAGVARMAQKYPEGIQAAAEKASTDAFQELLNVFAKAAPKQYEAFKDRGEQMFLEKLASELVSRVCPGRATAKQYLLGACAVDELLPYMKEWWYDFYQDQERYEKIAAMREMPDQSMYRRAVILEALKKEPDYFAQYPVYEEMDGPSDHEVLLFDGRQIRGLLRIFEAEQVPLLLQMEAFGGMSKNMGKKAKRELLLNRFVKILTDYGMEHGMERWEPSMAEIVLEGSAEACILCLKVLAQSGGEAYQKIYLSCASKSSKQVREVLLQICRPYPKWEPKILTLLGSKKVKEREFAAALLDEWGDPSCLPDVKAALALEKNKKLAELLKNLAEELEQEAAGAAAGTSGRLRRTEEKLAAEIFRGSRKRKVEWTESLSLPKVCRWDKEAVSPAYLSAILASYADMEVPGIHPDAKKLSEPLDPEMLAEYLLALYEAWLSAGAEAKKRWVLYAVSIHGGQKAVPLLHGQIKDWAEHQRGALAAEAVQALALNESPEALVLVDQMSRKHKSRQIRTAAETALLRAASALGISREELQDRLVPDLGTDQLTKKQQKEIFSGQKIRMEQVLMSARLWDVAGWKALFVQKPVMHPFAVGLIWGVYEGHNCQETFRYMEDGTYNTADGAEYVLSEDKWIGLVHPLELTAEEIHTWKEQLSDYEIEQPLEQLGRLCYRAEAEEPQTYAVSRFEDQMQNGKSLSQRLLSMGWMRGEIQDAGFFDAYCRVDKEFGARLLFSGHSVGFEDEEVTIRKMYFYRFSKEEPKRKIQELFSEENLCLPTEVPKRYFSEVLRQVGKAVGISTEKADF